MDSYPCPHTHIMSKLHFLKYKNYFSRSAKYETSLSGYVPYRTLLLSNTNFNPNDGVTATHVCNYTASSMPDYLVVCDDSNNIKSRWYIMEAKRNLSGQYTMQLYRDLPVDYREALITAPAFVEKATVDNADPAIFNSEDMTFNQIKTSETMLKDSSRRSWIVGYMAKDLDEAININSTVISGAHELANFTTTYTYRTYNQQTLTDKKKTGLHYKIKIPKRFISQGGNIDTVINYDISVYGAEGEYIRTSPPPNWGSTMSYVATLVEASPNMISNYDMYLIHANSMQYLDEQVQAYGSYTDHSTIEALLNENGKIYHDPNNGKYYQVSCSLTGQIESNLAVSAAKTRIKSNLNTYRSGHSGLFDTADIADSAIECRATLSTYYFEYTEVQTTAQITIDPATNVAYCTDAPYLIFAMPFKTSKDNDAASYKILTGGSTIATMTEQTAYQVANDLIVGLGTRLYDIQILPYCPLSNYATIQNNQIDINGTVYVPVKDQNENTVGAILWVTSSKFKVNIAQTISSSEPKIEHQCDTYRLVSPNYNGQFEFSPSFNRGVEGFEADCTYKPFQPYIHVAPLFKGMYGIDTDDARGLICGGDFSMAQISDQWVQYQINNKNYDNIFNRQIENMEVKQNVQKAHDIVNMITAPISGAMSGAAAGASSGVEGMGIAGAIIGGGLNLAGSIADYVVNENLRKEEIAYSTDMYGYNLQNIKALPNSLTKVSAFTNNNKLFPFIEYFTCTDTEKEALRNKIKYNGMTVMRISPQGISQYIREEESFIQAKIIRFDAPIGEEYHAAAALAAEIKKGLYI